MRLTPTERDRLLLRSAAELARARRARGLRLNVPEATALIADTVCEAARDGKRLAEAIEEARSVLGPDDVLPGVADVVTEVHVEAVFDDGSRLAVVPAPIRGAALLGDDAPGAVVPGPGAPQPEPALHLHVRNTAPVPVSVTSHFHFFEANPRLDFDRAAAYGMRLCVPAGSSVRFDPHGEAEIALVPIGGDRIAIGFAGLVDGPLDAPGAKSLALERAAACGYLGAEVHQDTDDGHAAGADAAQGDAARGDAARGDAAAAPGAAATPDTDSPHAGGTSA
ncbi:urease subunit gamma [Streptomyces sp. NPDC086989]|uniref:urease subunit gamma n=1 Tax=Streptomyces sp. NPDC086989 TaxID=3365764 RepID=UPI00382F0337